MVTVLCNDSEIEVEERCSLRDLRPGAGEVLQGDRHRDSRVLLRDMHTHVD